MNRKVFWYLSIAIWGFYWIGFIALEELIGPNGVLPLSIIVFISVICLSIRRLHDRDKSGLWLLILMIPIIGPTWGFIELGFLKGTRSDNQYGENPLEAGFDYLTVKTS